MVSFENISSELRHYLAWIGTGIAISRADVDSDVFTEIMDIVAIGEDLPPRLAMHNNFYKKAHNFTVLSKWCFKHSEEIAKLKDEYGEIADMGESEFLELYSRYIKWQQSQRGRDESKGLERSCETNPNATKAQG